MSTSSHSGPAVRALALDVRIDSLALLPPVDLSLEPGQTLAVTGPNGSGKTTLLRVLAGIQAPSNGSVEVLGAVPDERSAEFRGLVAALLGPPPLPRHLTLVEYLVLIGTSWGFTLEESRTRALELLTELRIAALAERFPHELSSGQSQLFALAVVLARPCSVLLLDEPEQRLDPERLQLVISALERRQAAGTTIVLASHSPLLVSRLADEKLELEEAVLGAPS